MQLEETSIPVLRSMFRVDIAVPTPFSCKPRNTQSQVPCNFLNLISFQNSVDLPALHVSALEARKEAGTRFWKGKEIRPLF